ncbi:ABC transporter substrate-binding protein [Pseudomonas sp. H9]|uniref:substrate-binding periplasmic protein n=1 Tax=Pseudomonas sp. H9 TaxID=483968 RepID=UPI0010580255|nr:transporter substrate-binding domain-containing protein [Pseudomonas sp. H9]TDF77414.1 ABC transporter substrate-binding protein [Pseudomonas sp. H9]
MRWLLSLLMLYVGYLPAKQPPLLRVALLDSWAMPLAQFENNYPVEGALPDLMNSLASQLGMRADFHVLPRLRLQSAMERGTIDVRCFVIPTWANDPSNQYTWSPPLFQQRDWLVAHEKPSTPVNLASLPRQTIGTVLGFYYPALQPQFDSGYFDRDDARNQLQVLQKLQARRNLYAVSSQWSLDWFNSQLPPEQRLHPLVMLEEQALGCMVRNDPAVPTQAILRTLARMKQSGEIERAFARYTQPATAPLMGHNP